MLSAVQSDKPRLSRLAIPRLGTTCHDKTLKLQVKKIHTSKPKGLLRASDGGYRPGLAYLATLSPITSFIPCQIPCQGVYRIDVSPSAPGRTRTCNPWFRRPGAMISKALIPKTLHQTTRTVAPMVAPPQLIRL